MFEKDERYNPNRLDHLLLSKEALRQNPILYSKIGEALRYEKDKVELVLKEVIIFLNLIVFSNEKLTPSLPVDKAWHELILCTKYYDGFCHQHFGRFIHHHPGGEEKINHQNFNKTIKLYTKYIGIPPETFWGDNFVIIEQASCGSCESD